QREAVVDVPLTPLRRGTARVDRLWLRWRGPLGLAWSGRVEELDLSIPAIPDIRGVRRAALALERRSALFGLKPQTTGGDGAEFDALRDYSPGMDRRAVDWKRTAKHRKLLVKEFQAERKGTHQTGSWRRADPPERFNWRSLAFLYSMASPLQSRVSVLVRAQALPVLEASRCTKRPVPARQRRFRRRPERRPSLAM
ncbi:MAG: DUF58 domain-containing protein, partial [Pseudomonadota bacterium]